MSYGWGSGRAVPVVFPVDVMYEFDEFGKNRGRIATGHAYESIRCKWLEDASIMKAVIMAGGEGSRLRPLTCDCPKPMAALMDKPVMEYALELLRRHGVEQVGVTLGYLPERIVNYFGDGEGFGVQLRYYTEEHPLGTAGSVRQARDLLDETFVVLSGDGLTDCDLTAALRFHRERGALATMVLKRVESPMEYGVVVAGPDGRVRRFVEKPGWGELCSDTANTGIYILEPQVLDYIPEDKPYDFGRELFPLLVQKNLNVFSWQMDGYWCDIGDTAAYLKAHVDMMDGRVNLPSNARPGGVVKLPGAQVDRAAVLEAPCFIGNGARVEAGARVGAYSVLGAGSVVRSGASIKRSVLWRGACVCERAQVRGSVLMAGSTVESEASAFEESVLGDGAVLGERSVLMPSVRVWPYKRVEDGQRVDQNLVWGTNKSLYGEGGVLPVQGPAQAARITQAYCAALKPGDVVLGCDASAEGMAYSRAALAGLMAQGVQAIDAGTCTLPQLREVMWSTGAQGGLYARPDGVVLLAEQGAALSRAQSRSLTGALAREDYARAFSGLVRRPVALCGSELTYIGALLEDVDVRRLRGEECRVAAYAPSELLLSRMEKALVRSGCTVRAEWEEEMMELDQAEIGLWLNETGESVRFADHLGMFNEAEMQQLLAWTALQMGARTLVWPVGMTRTVEALAEQYGAQIHSARSERAEWMRALLEQDDVQFRLQFDGIYASVNALAQLRMAHLTLEGFRRMMPVVHRRTRSVPVELKDRARALRRLAEQVPDADLTDGIRVEREGGWAWIGGADERGACRVITEAQSAEFARELCDFYAGALEQVAHEAQEQK